jgi:hypothetical protein
MNQLTEKTFEEKIASVHGLQVYRGQIARLSKGDTLIVTFFYLVDTGATSQHKFTLRLLINDSGELSIYDLKKSFTSFISENMAEMFCSCVKFSHIQFKCVNQPMNTNKIYLNGLYGLVDESPSIL